MNKLRVLLADLVSPPQSTTIWRLGMLSALGVFLVDLFTKQAILESQAIARYGRISAFPFLDLVLEYNTGISFGLAPQQEWWGRLGLGIFNVLVAVGIVFWLRRCKEFWTGLGLSLLIGGALGNAVDRLVFGAVVDFVYLHVGDFHWYVFNVADVGIVASIPCLVFGIVRPRDLATHS